MSLDREQEAVVLAPPESRILVEAGPGCGKTHVVCERAARLIHEEGLNPNEILIVSFTRTAIREMRNRIAAAASESPIGGLDIQTIDQLAYRINGRILNGDYRNSIEAAACKLGEDDGTVDVLAYRHVFVDEAQDIGGCRATFVRELLAGLVRVHEAGVTVFHDPAQAIYDWQIGRDESPEPVVTGLLAADMFEQTVVLIHDYRTKETAEPEFVDLLAKWTATAGPELVDLLAKARTITLAGGEGASEGVRELLIAEGGGWSDKELKDLASRSEIQSSLVLFKSCVEVLAASWQLAKDDGQPHGLRFGGLPRRVEPWIAFVLNEIGENRFTQAQFETAWIGLETLRLAEGWSCQAAWDLLFEFGGQAGARVDAGRIADLVARESPPMEFTPSPVGGAGLVLSTIHGSKGREADYVLFSVPKLNSESDGTGRADEECRQLYVGLSRAKQGLHCVKGMNLYPRKRIGRGKRPWRTTKTKDAAQVGIGMRGDLDPVRDLGVATGEPDVQETLTTWPGTQQSLACFKSEGRFGDWDYRLLTSPDETIVGRLDSQVQDDLGLIRREMGSRGAPGSLNGVRWVDVSSCGVSREQAVNLRLKEPYATTRVWLAPMVIGYAWIPAALKTGKRRSR